MNNWISSSVMVFWHNMASRLHQNSNYHLGFTGYGQIMELVRVKHKKIGLIRTLPGFFAITLLFGFIQLNPKMFHENPFQTTNSNWSRPHLVFEDPNGHLRLDYMFADSSGAVHLFWAYNPNPTNSNLFQESDTFIYYLLRKETFIGNAIDILSNEQATMPFSQAWDQNGQVYMATRSGNSNCLNFMSASILDLANAKAWSEPVCLQEQGAGSPVIITSPTGALYIVFIKPDQRSISIMKSINQGKDWSSPRSIYTTTRKDVFLNEIQAVIDEGGQIHVTWNEVQAPDGYPPVRLMYFRSSDDGTSWSTPFELAGSDQADQNLTTDKNFVYAIWNGDVGYKGRYFRMSKDRGLTWSDRVTLPLDQNIGGLQGPPGIIVDNLGTVHVLYANDPYLYYNTFKDGVWGNPELIAGPDNTEVQQELDRPFLAITEGNKLHALFTRDAVAVYYMEKTIPAQHENPIPFIRPTPTSETEDLNAIQIAEIPSMVVDKEKLQTLPTEQVPKNQQIVILIAVIIPVSSLILLAYILKRTRQ